MRSWNSPEVPTLPAASAGHRIQLRDTVTGQLRPTGGPGTTARLYVCGITPYDATHLGHASTYLNFDLLVRAWLDAGREVAYAQNVTDIDDPLLERADQTGVNWQDLAEEQTDLFRSDMTHLRVIAPDHYIGAVESIPVIVRAVYDLAQRGLAYYVPTQGYPDGEGDLYADLHADPDALQSRELAELNLPQVFAERGGDPERPGKRDALDPLLWLRARAGEPSWDGQRLGAGRPGWHVECSCIALKYLGEHIEVQGGGSDLIFPHHAMSTSHLRMITGTSDPVDIHTHVGMVAYEGEKMSKSLGNLVLVSRLIADGVEPGAVRLAVYAHHYAADWEYTEDLLEQAQRRLELWRRAQPVATDAQASALLETMRSHLASDLDAPAALAAVDEWAESALAAQPGAESPADAGPADQQAGLLVGQILDALLGVRL